jgi:hypothetical protein
VLLEREVVSFEGASCRCMLARAPRPIERAVAGIRIPASFASEAYTLREHVGLVRRAILARVAAAASDTTPAPGAQGPAPA